MKNGIEWNGNFGMEYARCQNGMEDLKKRIEFEEWNGRQSSILPYPFHASIRALYLQKNIRMSGSDR